MLFFAALSGKAGKVEISNHKGFGGLINDFAFCYPMSVSFKKIPREDTMKQKIVVLQKGIEKKRVLMGTCCTGQVAMAKLNPYGV
jgi:hypothetical protein